MGKAHSKSYRAFMHSLTRSSKSARSLATSALLLICGAWSCGDGDELSLDVGVGSNVGAGEAGAAPTAGSSGSGGAAGGRGDTPGIAGTSASDAGAGGNLEHDTPTDAGQAGESDGPGPAAGGEPTVPPEPAPGVVCYGSDDSARCDDGLYCNGVELCRPRILGGSDLWVCKAPLQGPCGSQPCDEVKHCDCSNPDEDGDDYFIAGCTNDPEKVDCDDDDGNRNPAREEKCDLENPEYDEDCNDRSYGDKDDDDDGYVDDRCANVAFHQQIAVPQEGSGVPVGLSPPLEMYRGNDCNDGYKLAHPGGFEVCDNEDNDCNGIVDEVFGMPAEQPAEYYRDRDGDHYGNSAEVLKSLCLSPPDGYVNEGGDCADRDATVTPLRLEVCNGKDDDCNGTTDLHITPGTPLVDMPLEDGMEFECQGVDGWVVTRCPPGRLECSNPNYRDACETIGTTMCNCRACGATCSFSCGETSCDEIAEISTGSVHTCAIARPTSDRAAAGTAVCWGWNLYGQLGTGTMQDSPTPTAVQNLPRVTSIATGDAHSCAVADGRVYCWGFNEDGQLGQGLVNPLSSSPLLVRAPYEGAKATQVASGSLHTCAIYDGGALACWGSGQYGQLGDDDSGEGHVSNMPSRVRRRLDGELEHVNDSAQVVGGYLHTCALSVAGKVECWGDNSSGQIGQPIEAVPFSTIAMPVPELESLIVDEISAAAFLTCARAGSDVLCWGSNFAYELARDDVETSSSPALIPLPGAARRIAVGNSFGCAVTAEGSLYCWGSNYYGERGTSADPPPVLPNLVGIADVVGIFGGSGNHVCAVGETSGWCWGLNDYGQLGTGSVEQLGQPAPTRVHALRGVNACP
jgi:alpha-tubulin suppressor-like RCC1 family protein